LQVASIVAVTSGTIDELPVADVRRFERELHDYLSSRHGDLLGKLAREKLSDELSEALKSAIADFASSFTPSEVVETEEVNEGWDAMAASSESVE
jgi:F-type H+-transporting ATPase subunit alpha